MYTVRIALAFARGLACSDGSISRVANMSQEWARAVLDVEVAYDTDLGHAMAVIKAVADEVWEDNLDNATIIEEPEIWGRTENHNFSGNLVY